MRITRQRLKQIILEEIAALDINDEEKGNVPGDGKQEGDAIATISETEGIELAQQVAQVLFDNNITAAESPEQLAMAIKGLVKMGVLALGGGALGVAATAGTDAINKLRGTNPAAESDEESLDEETGDTLGDLIKQAVQEQLEEMTSKKN